MRKEFVAGKLPVWVSIYDGHTHIDRRVYIDEAGERFVKINAAFVDMDWIYRHWEAHIYF